VDQQPQEQNRPLPDSPAQGQQPVSVAIGALTAEEFASVSPEDQALAERAVQSGIRVRGVEYYQDPENLQELRDQLLFWLASFARA
jgi:hypothetical protein